MGVNSSVLTDDDLQRLKVYLIYYLELEFYILIEIFMHKINYFNWLLVLLLVWLFLLRRGGY